MAVTLAAGPMLLAFELIRSNTRAAEFNLDRATARMVLLDLATLLDGQGLAAVQESLTPASLSRVLSERIALMPEAAREPYFEQARNVLGQIQGKLDPDIDSSKPGLARLELSARLPDGVVVQVSALIRPKARERVRVDVDPSCGTTGGAGAP